MPNIGAQAREEFLAPQRLKEEGSSLEAAVSRDEHVMAPEDLRHRGRSGRGQGGDER